MGVIQTKTFMNGEGVAVALPDELGIAPDISVTIERVGNTLTIKPALDMVEEKRKLTELMTRLREIWKDVPPDVDRGQREPIEFPDRPGLY